MVLLARLLAHLRSLDVRGLQLGANLLQLIVQRFYTDLLLLNKLVLELEPFPLSNNFFLLDLILLPGHQAGACRDLGHPRSLLHPLLEGSHLLLPGDSLVLKQKARVIVVGRLLLELLELVALLLEQLGQVEGRFLPSEEGAKPNKRIELVIFRVFLKARSLRSLTFTVDTVSLRIVEIAFASIILGFNHRSSASKNA